MTEIKAFTPEYLGDVASLYMKAMRGKPGPGSPALQEYFREIFLNNPWVSEEIPSLVYFHQGSVVGFMGVVPREMEFEGRAIRVATTSQFMVERDPYRGPAAVALLLTLFKGPQDLTFGDGASEYAAQVFAGGGGFMANLYSFNWLRLLRPLQTVRNYLDRSSWVAGSAFSALSRPVEYVLSKLPYEAFRVPQSRYSATPVNADELLKGIHESGWREPLKPVYEASSFRWLISQAAAARRMGDLQMSIVRDQKGDLVGWYVYWVLRGGPANVLQLGVRRKDYFDGVLSALFRDAWTQGASSVKGQSVPQHLVSLSNQYCLFRHLNTSVVFNTRDVRMQDAIFRGKAALSHLDGECWMRFSSEPWV